MNKTYDFKRESTAQGRNGVIKMTGVDVFKSSIDSIFISPLTSRKKVGNCWIEIPQEELPAFIDLLKEYL